MDFIGSSLGEIIKFTTTLQEFWIEAGEQLEESQQSNLMSNWKENVKSIIMCEEKTRIFNQKYTEILCQDQQLMNFKNELRKNIDSNPEIRWSKHKKYQDFRERIWEVNHPEEEVPRESSESDSDDLVVSSTKQSLICPLTQRLLQDPMLNPSCGHSYSRNAIFSLARSSASIPCPITGCNHSVNMKSLIPNESLERRISRRNAIRIFH